MKNPNDPVTDFGYKQVPVNEKAEYVEEVFNSVAHKYDLMNDLMSFGIHRFWKQFAIHICTLGPRQVVLDIAGGTGDLATKISPIVGEQGRVVLADINFNMLTIGRSRLLDRGIYKNVSIVQGDAEQLPFPDNYFDRVIISFGLRNVTSKQTALQSLYRVLKPGGKLVILEFSKPTLPGLQWLYDAYCFKVLPRLGQLVANDADSYRYLSESIRMHPDQLTLRNMLEVAQFANCDYHNLTGGIVAVHRGYKY